MDSTRLNRLLSNVSSVERGRVRLGKTRRRRSRHNIQRLIVFRSPLISLWKENKTCNTQQSAFSVWADLPQGHPRFTYIPFQCSNPFLHLSSGQGHRLCRGAAMGRLLHRPLSVGGFAFEFVFDFPIGKRNRFVRSFQYQHRRWYICRRTTGKNRLRRMESTPAMTSQTRYLRKWPLNRVELILREQDHNIRYITFALKDLIEASYTFISR